MLRFAPSKGAAVTSVEPFNVHADGTIDPGLLDCMSFSDWNFQDEAIADGEPNGAILGPMFAPSDYPAIEPSAEARSFEDAISSLVKVRAW